MVPLLGQVRTFRNLPPCTKEGGLPHCLGFGGFTAVCRAALRSGFIWDFGFGLAACVLVLAGGFQHSARSISKALVVAKLLAHI